MVGGEVGGEVSNKGVQRTCSEELNSMFPLGHFDEVWVANNFETGRFKGLVQFVESLLFAIAGEKMEFGSRLRLVGNFGDIVVKGLGVLNGRCVGVVLVVELGEQVISLHIELPGRPGP
jgi:hypothetical protein